MCPLNYMGVLMTTMEERLKELVTECRSNKKFYKLGQTLDGKIVGICGIYFPSLPTEPYICPYLGENVVVKVTARLNDDIQFYKCKGGIR